MSRGITPVIAIILLLLMAVAAAGGFYFVYQGFTSEGEASGSEQIESLGEQALSALTIESAAGGRLYVRNTGASDLDLSQVTVYVENVPYNVNVSTETLGERERATLKFTQAPSCSGRCEVRISGPASTSQGIDADDLACFSDDECRASETCTSGVCVGVTVQCGDGTCDYPAENGIDCFQDCHPERVLSFSIDPVGSDHDTYDCPWNGSTYVKSENITNNALFDFFYKYVVDSSGNMISVGSQGVTQPFGDIIWAKHDGSSWTNYTLSDEPWGEGELLLDIDISPTNDNVIAMWPSGYVNGYEVNASWSLYDGSSWTTAENLTENTNPDMLVNPPQFSFADDGTGLAAWGSRVSTGKAWLNYSIWDGSSWSAIESLTERELDNLKGGEVEHNSTHYMVVWYEQNTTYDPPEVLRWATYDGTTWDGPHNVTDERNDFDEQIGIEPIDDGWILVVNQGGTPSWLHWYDWNDGWTLHGNMTSENLPGKGLVMESVEGELLLFFTGTDIANPDYHYSYYDGSQWAEYVEFGSVWE